MKKIEIACFNEASALIASKAGADRIELCEGYKIGGITPQLDLVKRVRGVIKNELNVMIRPTHESFNYSSIDFLLMQESIKEMKKIGVDGFVFGVLTNENKIDVERNKILIELASPLPCTFHRAFDSIENKREALQILKEIGFATVLTSGETTNAIEGKEILKDLVHWATNDIIVMPGGGIRSTNIQFLDNQIKAKYYHSAALKDGKETVDFDEVIRLKEYLTLA